MSVDGTDFPINEPSPFWDGWFSYKFHGAGLRYEVAVCIATGDIVWVNGPYPPGRFPDMKIFKLHLKQMLLPWEMVEVDAGYKGCPYHCSNKMDQFDEQHGKEKGVVRARQETANERFKNFNILHDTFRHDISKHKEVFHAVAAISQLSIRTESPLFQIEKYESFLKVHV